MNELEQYKAMASEIIIKQAILLGPRIAVEKARAVKEMKISDDGKVFDIEGDAPQALQKLIDEYIALSGSIVQSVTKSIFSKYPNIKCDNCGV